MFSKQIYPFFFKRKENYDTRPKKKKKKKPQRKARLMRLVIYKNIIPNIASIT